MFLYSRGKRQSFKEIADTHFNSLFPLLQKRLKALTSGKNKWTNFYKDVISNDYKLLKAIIMGDLNDLKQIVEDVNRSIRIKRYPEILRKNKKGQYILTGFGESISRVFNYPMFCIKNGKYTAYDLTDALGINVCPYCNRGYTFTINESDGIVRPELDHYLPKSIYPYLGLSFYNLIPSCHICNSGLKHDANFNLDEYIHPYRESLHNAVSFTVKFVKKTTTPLSEIKKTLGVSFFYGDLESFEVDFKRVAVDTTDGDLLYKRAINSLTTFKIKEIYNQHKDLIVEMVLNTIIYDDDYINSLLSQYGGTLFRGREDVIRHITNNYPSSDKMPERTFSKLSNDIHSEFGLIF